MDLVKTLSVAASGMKAQGARLRVVAENIANANSVSTEPGQDPYRRKVISFRNELDRELGIDRVQVDAIDFDKSDFKQRYDPGHPNADDQGYVKLPNVNSLIEAMDMREAQRSYEANLGMIRLARTMIMRTIDVLRA